MIISELVRIHVLKEYIADGEGPQNSMVEKVWEACEWEDFTIWSSWIFITCFYLDVYFTSKQS